MQWIFILGLKMSKKKYNFIVEIFISRGLINCGLIIMIDIDDFQATVEILLILAVFIEYFFMILSTI